MIIGVGRVIILDTPPAINENRTPFKGISGRSFRCGKIEARG